MIDGFPGRAGDDNAGGHIGPPLLRADLLYLWFLLHGVPPFLNKLTLYHEADRVGEAFLATPSRLYEL